MKFLIFFLFSSINLFSQQLAVTIKGDTIEIYDNKTWQKYNSESYKVEEIKTSVKATVKVDEFTNKRSVSTETGVIFAASKHTTLRGSAYMNETGIISFTLTLNGDLGCLSKMDSTMMIKLSNGDVVPLTYISDIDCSNYITGAWLAITKEDVNNPNYSEVAEENNELLKNYNWTKIRITGTEHYADLEPKVSRRTEKPQQFFREHILALESKK